MAVVKEDGSAPAWSSSMRFVEAVARFVFIAFSLTALTAASLLLDKLDSIPERYSELISASDHTWGDELARSPTLSDPPTTPSLVTKTNVYGIWIICFSSLAIVVKTLSGLVLILRCSQHRLHALFMQEFVLTLVLSVMHMATFMAAVKLTADWTKWLQYFDGDSSHLSSHDSIRTTISAIRIILIVTAVLSGVCLLVLASWCVCAGRHRSRRLQEPKDEAEIVEKAEMSLKSSSG